jgi:hypothetical protein
MRVREIEREMGTSVSVYVLSVCEYMFVCNA